MLQRLNSVYLSSNMSTRSSTKSKTNQKSAGKPKAFTSATVPYLLILMGLPGSGKSTVSKELTTKGWIHINQDALGSADECKKALAKAVKHGRSVVLDRCNVHAKERKMWITETKANFSEGQEYNFQLLFMDTPIDLCKERAAARKNHETLSPEVSAAVIDDFAKNLKAPETWEGYEKIYRVTNSDELKEALKELKSYPVKLK